MSYINKLPADLPSSATKQDVIDTLIQIFSYATDTLYGYNASGTQTAGINLGASDTEWFNVFARNINIAGTNINLNLLGQFTDVAGETGIPFSDGTSIVWRDANLHKNLILNPDFKINQRLVSSPFIPPEGSGNRNDYYGLDKWFTTSNYAFGESDDGSVRVTLSVGSSIYQTISSNALNFSDSLTLSAEVGGYGNLVAEYAYGTNLRDGIANNGSSSITYYSFTNSVTQQAIPANNYFTVKFTAKNGDVTLTDIQIERGDINTGFEPVIASEQEMYCRRYYQSLNTGGDLPLFAINNQTQFVPIYPMGLGASATTSNVPGTTSITVSSATMYLRGSATGPLTNIKIALFGEAD